MARHCRHADNEPAWSFRRFHREHRPIDVQKHMVIDGQQRLTSLTMLLLVLRDDAAKHPDACNMPQSKFMNCLKNVEDLDENRYKIIPAKKDRDVLFRLIEGLHFDDLRPSSSFQTISFF